MKRLFYLEATLLLAVILFSSSLLAKELPIPHTITIITSNKKPISNVSYVKHTLQQTGGVLEIYNLDEVHAFESSFSQGLPANEDKARKQFEQKMKAYGIKNFEQDIVKAYQGLFKALVYGVDRYPVIIFNKTEAIYGMTDLKAALLKYQQWRLKNAQ